MAKSAVAFYQEKKTLFYSFFVIIFISVCISNGLYAADNWKLVKNSDGVEVYTRPHKNSSLEESKGIITIDAPIDILYTILLYGPTHKKLMHNCYDSFFVKPWENGHTIHYWAFKTTWPCWNRDLLLEVRGKVDPKTGNVITTHMSFKEPLVPIKENMIRIMNSENTMIYKKITPNRTRVTYINYTDPGGIVPKFIINILCIDLPYYSLKNLRELAKDPIYKDLAAKYRLE
jgi:hypothetical protein